MNEELPDCRECRAGELTDPVRLGRLVETGLLDSPREAVFDRHTRFLVQSLGVPVALVSLVDDRRQFFKSSTGLGEPWATRRETPLSHSFCQHVVLEGRPLVVEDAREDPRLRGNRAIDELRVLAYAGYPIATRDGQVLGSLCVIDSRPRAWSRAELELLSHLSFAISTEVDLRLEIAAREETEIQLMRSMERVVMVNSELERFTRVASHDLKAPLRGIVGCLSVLEQILEPLESDAAELMEQAINAGSRSIKLIDALRAYSELERQELTFKSVCLDELLEEIRGDLREFEAEFEIGDLGTVEGDPVLLEQLFRNLLSNSLKYQAQETTPEISIRREGDEFFVKDNGIGIEERYLDEIFEEFKRLHGVDKYEGSGLGLAICRRVVERHGGRIRAESEVGKGTTIRFTLKGAAK